MYNKKAQSLILQAFKLLIEASGYDTDDICYAYEEVIGMYTKMYPFESFGIDFRAEFQNIADANAADNGPYGKIE